MGDEPYDKEKLQKAFAQVLKAYRKRRGISQEKLALDCGLDRSFVGMLERGTRTPSLRTIFMVADQLNISPSKMVREVEKIIND